ncbi:MAG: DNA polymerase III subunit delta' [Oscillibacter sp.]|nr:DNA polymerase III subunit delta' [Oscillibacter sp.]
MGPFGIIEQDPAAGRIRRAADRGTLSHALLFTGGGDLLSAARFAAAAMECTAPGGRPCGVCQGCRKTLADIHPDVVTVRDEQHKLIAVDAVRAVRSDAYVRPNEGQRKVYLFPDCALLTEQDQNVLLKLVEEGPPYAAFLFCAENASGVLPTLRSRCVELKLRPAGSGGAASENGETLCRALAERRRGAMAEACVRLERGRLTREDLADMLAWSREAFAQALLALYGRPARAPYDQIAPILAKNLTKDQIMSTIELLQKYRGDCAFAVGPGHVLGALAAEWEGILWQK